MLTLVVAHFAVAALLPLVSARSTRAAFGVAALLPAAAFAWAMSRFGDALAGGVASVVEWAPTLGLALAFRLDALALAMVVLVSGVGALVLGYCIGYFPTPSPLASRTAALLLAFAGAMLGLVLADDLLTLYVFWELTSIASFLLIGQSGEEGEERRAAVQALVVTVLGGLAMLLGFVLLGQAAGTYRISAILADPPRGGLVTAALVLVLLGAVTKSAQLPFHPWLPAAMVAPTPVSAYLHAAAMVKAGVYLVARLSPGFAELTVWWLPLVVVGLATMIVGGWRALAENDLKRLLALGTVSQLGFLMVLFGVGARIAALAGVAMLLAHGLFKAALFLVVGTVDRSTGTRDLRRLSGVGRAMPGLVVATALAVASMAGLPPLLGFIGKETGFAAFLHTAGQSGGGLTGWTIAVGLLVGSVLTTAYSARVLWGAYAAKPGAQPTAVRPPSAWLTAPVWVCAVAGLALGIGYPAVDTLAAGYADLLPAADPEAARYHLALWHGWGLPVLFTAVAIGGGLVLHAARGRVSRLVGRSPLDAQRGYERCLGGLNAVSVFVTGRSQVGSLPAYLGVILLTFVVLPGVAVVAADAWPGRIPAYHALLQVPLAAAVAVAALAVLRARRRITAVLLVGVVGYGVGGLFIVEGAPDLALAQFLVETLSLVAFVLVLRRMPAHFTERRLSRRVRLPKGVIAAAGGLTVGVMSVVLSGSRDTPSPVSEEYVRLAGEVGATNVVNAIIVDFRALDTVGEISVLLIAAVGVASLVLATESGGPGPEVPTGIDLRDEEDLL